MINRMGHRLATIALALLLTPVAIGVAQSDEGSTKAHAKSDQNMNIMVDVHPTKGHAGTSLASSLHPLMVRIGRPDWSLARLQGVMGHAFQFEMKDGGKWVYHDNSTGELR